MSEFQKIHGAFFGLGPCPKGNGTEFFLELVGTSVLWAGTTVVPRRVRSSREAVELIRRAQHGVLSQGRKFMQPFRAPAEELGAKPCTSRSALMRCMGFVLSQ